jgi:hypothetical protein
MEATAPRAGDSSSPSVHFAGILVFKLSLAKERGTRSTAGSIFHNSGFNTRASGCEFTKLIYCYALQ